MRIGVVGNSHATAVRRDARARASEGSHTFEFLVDPGGVAPRIEVRDGKLVRVERKWAAQAGELPGRVNPAVCDAIIFAAAGLPAHRIGWPNHPLNYLLHAGFAAAPYASHQSVTGEVLALALQRRLQELPNIQALRIVRSVFGGPIVIFTAPMPSSRIKVGQPEIASDLSVQYGENLLTFIRWYYDVQTKFICEEARAIDAHALLPPEPYRKAGFTPEEFCIRDGWHMNEAYWRIMLDQALDLLSRA